MIAGMKQARHTHPQRTQRLSQPRDSFAQWQRTQRGNVIRWIADNNAFYQAHWKGARQDAKEGSEIDFESLPLTTKSDLVGSDPSGHCRNLSFAADQYLRFHRTSGTTGQPMVVLDTADDWQFWMEGWQFVLDVADLNESDSVLMAFSFGPFVGFWSAFDAVVERGALVIPTGSLSTEARLDLIETSKPTTLFCTPSYALHLAEYANQKNIDLANSSVNKIVVAGEPGGSLAEIRHRIESAFAAKVFDHAGATEIGPWGFADAEGTGLFVNESLFYPEFLDPETNQCLDPDTSQTEGQVCQLALTTLGRLGCPVVRYLTGDLVRPTWKKESPFVFLEGGVLSRADDMMIIRGVNVFPSSIEAILRGIEGVDEFRIEVYRQGEMDQLRIIAEDHQNDPNRIAQQIQLRLGLRVEVELAEPGSLPRFEMKGQRFVDKR